ncbi:MAG: Rrf2 family transcriptional regulator [Ruminococcus sp.]|nr:Rrf2 family transcriptional regulator [Ruminococcus sp.]
MYITLETDYAVRIVSVLCIDGGKIDAKTISERSGVMLRFALKILRKLVSADIIKSYKGAQGGYEINRDPSEITLRMVIEAIEGTYYFSRCLSDEKGCSRGADGACCYQRAFGEITKMVREKLDSYNFADMINHSEEFRERCNEQEGAVSAE